VQDLTDPQHWNGYTYSNSNPTTFSDPSGLSHDPPLVGARAGAMGGGEYQVAVASEVRRWAKGEHAGVGVSGDRNA
jgi:hypothetical protein